MVRLPPKQMLPLVPWCIQCDHIMSAILGAARLVAVPQGNDMVMA